MRTIECPNCGAPATNHQNCNFCGSLMIRFADKGLASLANEYLRSHSVLPGLLNHLHKNIEIQEQAERDNSKDVAQTDIWIDDEIWSSGKHVICTVLPAANLALGSFTIDSSGYFDIIQPFENYEGISLATLFTFQIFKDAELAPIERERLNNFKKLSSFPLFESYVYSSSDDFGNEYTTYEYAINFGRDEEGAAMLISEVAEKVYGCDPNNTLECYTNNSDVIDNIRSSITGVKQGISYAEETDSDSSANWKKWVWIGISIVGGLIYLFS